MTKAYALKTARRAAAAGLLAVAFKKAQADQGSTDHREECPDSLGMT